MFMLFGGGFLDLIGPAVNGGHLLLVSSLFFPLSFFCIHIIIFVMRLYDVIV